MTGKQVSRSRIPDGLIRMEISISDVKHKMIVGGDKVWEKT